MRVEGGAGTLAEFFRSNPQVVRYLVCLIRSQRAAGQPLEWYRVRDGIIPLAVAPRYLEKLVRAGVLQCDSRGRYWVDLDDDVLLEGLYPAVVTLAKQVALENSRRAAAEAARRAEEAEQRARWELQQEELRRAEAARVAEEHRQRELWERQQEDARRAEEERRRLAAEQEREQARRLRVWEQGDAREVVQNFGRGEAVLMHLVKRGLPRRDITRELHVGEHRVARIRKQLAGSLGPARLLDLSSQLSRAR